MFKKPGYTDEKDGKDIARLVSEMQDLGGPPKEVMGDLPEGFVSCYAWIPGETLTTALSGSGSFG